MTIKHVDVYEDPGGWTWKIVELDDNATPKVIARGPAYGDKKEALKYLFGIFFGDFDESFLTLYAEWNPDQQQAALFPQPEPVPVSFSGEGGMTASMQPAQPMQAADPLWGDSDPALGPW